MNRIKYIFGLAAMLLTMACGGQSAEGLAHIDVQQFKAGIEKKDIILLDVRTPEEYAQGHIPEASTINFYAADFKEKVNLIQKDKEVYVYCRSGNRSGQAAKIMMDLGFQKVNNLIGGIGAWHRAGFPLEAGQQKVDKNIQSLAPAQFKKIIIENEIVLVDFHTQWCVPCRKMSPIVDELEKEMAGKAKIMRIDMDASKDLAAAYQVTAVPTFLLFKGGEEIWRATGLQSKETLSKQLQ